MSGLEQHVGVAEELADAQRSISIAEFFEQNKQMLGFGSQTRALVTAVKEAVDNSLDATEEADILPDIRVEIMENEEYYTLIVEDNGPGIPKDSVPKVFGKLLYGSRFDSRSQTRGQQGIGISAAVLYSQLTSGNPARITSKPAEENEGYYVELGIDTDTNEPEIQTEESVDWEKDHGTRIELDMDGNMRARKQLHKYIRHTAVVNPHATIELYEPDDELIFDERPVEELPDDVEEIKPHPHGVELGTLQDMLEKTKCYKLKAFFQEEFTRVGAKTAEGILDNFRDASFGQGLAWPAVTERTPEEDYHEAITDNVHGKGKEATEIFASDIVETLSNEDSVTRENVADAVEGAAQVAEDETGKQFADTVQEKAVDAVWGLVVDNVQEFTIERVDAVTIDRKHTELVARVGREMAKRLEDDGATRISRSELESVVEDASEVAVETIDNGISFGETAQDKVIDDFWERGETVSDDVPLVREVENDRDLASALLEGMQRADAMAPPTKCLSPIGENDIEVGLRARYDADFYTSVTRSAGVARGEPFVVEAGIAYGGELEGDGQIQLSRFANRVPLVYQQGACAMTKVVKDIRWNNYYTSRDKLSQTKNSLPQGPMVLMVHIASTNVPFTSESKDAVSSVPEIEKEVENAVRGAARNLKDYMREQRTRRKRKQKRDVMGGILQDMTDKLENITGTDVDSKEESQARILNNVYVNNEQERELTITNYGGKSETVRLTGELEDGSSFDDEISLSKGESTTLSYDEAVTDLSVEEPNKPKVTLVNE